MSKNQFLAYLELEKKYSFKTIESYAHDLTSFETYCELECGIEEISKAEKTHLRGFVMKLTNARLSDRSINRKISCLKSYFKYLLKIGEIESNPASFIQTLKSNPKIQIPFSKDELKEVLDSDLNEIGYSGVLKNAIVETLYQTGMRRMELIGLKIEDVDLIKNQIKVLGKGNKERMIPISSKFANLLKNYSEARDKEFVENKWFFLTKSGKPLYQEFVYKTVTAYLSQVTSKQKRSPHVLRHSFASHTLNNGADLNSIKELLGHSSLAATQVYTHADIEQLKKVFNQAHPREQKN